MARRTQSIAGLLLLLVSIFAIGTFIDNHPEIPVLLVLALAAYIAYRLWRRTHLYSDEALTCYRCGSLAAPLPGTGNRYRCPSCSKQFAGARHSF